MLARNLLLIVGTLAVVVGLALAFSWLRMSSSDATVAAVVAEPQVAILVASRAIPIGTLLRVQDLTWNNIPAGSVNSAYTVRGTASEADFVGAVTRVSLGQNEPLVSDAYVRPGDRDFLVATLAPGYRAVSIGVDAAQSGAGLMLAGDRVDVVLTQTFSAQGPSDPGRRSVGETILYNLRIIAVDQTLGASPKESNSKLVPSQESPIPKTITLEVQERQAEVLLVAEQLGKIQLTLRGQSLSGAVPQTPAAVPPTWAFDVSPALAKLGTAVPPLAKAQGSIEVIHGAKSEHLCPAGSGFVACP